jgi:CHAD domain-containing protein
VVDVRALLPRAAVHSTRTVGTQRNRAGKVVARVIVDAHVESSADDGAALPRWIVVVEGLAGYDAAARRTREILELLGLADTAGDVLDLVAASAPPGFDSSPTVSLDARDRADIGYRAVFRRLLDTIEATFVGTVDEVDPEFLHDFRVAVRRSRSVLKRARHVLPEPAREHYRAEFAWLAAATGRARDLDVYVIEWDSYVEPLPPDARAALLPMLEVLRGRRIAAHAELARALRSRRYGTLVHDWRQWLRDAGEHDGRDAGKPLARVVERRILAAQRQVLDRGRAITPDSPGTDLHELRKDAKLLRYLIECFGGVYAPRSRKAFVRELKALQDHLGTFQDAEVHLAELRALSEELGAAGGAASTLLAMGQLAEHLERRRADARDQFGARFRRYDSKVTKRALRALLDAAASTSKS